MEFTAKMLEEGSKLDDEYDFDPDDICDGDCVNCSEYGKCTAVDWN